MYYSIAAISTRPGAVVGDNCCMINKTAMLKVTYYSNKWASNHAFYYALLISQMVQNRNGELIFANYSNNLDIKPYGVFVDHDREVGHVFCMNLSWVQCGNSFRLSLSPSEAPSPWTTASPTLWLKQSLCSMQVSLSSQHRHLKFCQSLDWFCRIFQVKNGDLMEVVSMHIAACFGRRCGSARIWKLQGSCLTFYLHRIWLRLVILRPEHPLRVWFEGHPLLGASAGPSGLMRRFTLR